MERRKVNDALLEHYRCPEIYVDFTLSGELSDDSGYFRFGQDAICYGQSCSGSRAKLLTSELYDALADVTVNGSAALPFDPTQVVENLRLERYVRDSRGASKAILQNAYYLVRSMMSPALRKRVQRTYFKGWEKQRFPNWPVDWTVESILETLLVLSLKARSLDRIPFIWFWPDGAPSCAVVTHDIETLAGRDFCSTLMDIDDSFAIKSAFQIIPEERYPVLGSFLDEMRGRGFEINVHDSNHDGYLFKNREEFLRRAQRINQYGRDFGALGFRSGILYRNEEWYEALDFAYDMSIPNVAHLDPQRGGCCTVMPFFIDKLLELPTTATQDYTLFNILNDYSIDLWKRQVAFITEKHGLANFIVHPDYVVEKRAQRTYKELLEYLVLLRSDGKIWVALPREVDHWWRQRRQMRLVRSGDKWRVEGPGQDKALIAYASLANDRLVYTLEKSE